MSRYEEEKEISDNLSKKIKRKYKNIYTKLNDKSF